MQGKESAILKTWMKSKNTAMPSREKFPHWQWETETVAGRWELKGIHPKDGFEEVIKVLANLEGARMHMSFTN